MKTKSEQILEKGWGGALTNEIVGKILLLSDDADMWDEALAFIGGFPSSNDIDDFIEKMEEIINSEGGEK